MWEIGSEFCDVPIQKEKNGLFPISTQWYLSGRCALRAIVAELRGAKSVAMPSWCCDSMIIPFLDAGIEVHFYPVYWKDGLIQEVDLKRDALFLMDYFGYTTKSPDLSGYSGIVIRDITHSLFSTTYNDADYYFGSLRKWCGIITGGYAWTQDSRRLIAGNVNICEYNDLRHRAMQEKREYLTGLGSNKDYLQLFKEAEELLETAGIAQGDNKDSDLALTLDAGYIKEQRRKNAEVLRSAFPEWLIFPEMKEDDCPMFVPIVVPDNKRDDLYRHLIKNRVYCPIHWTESEYHKLSDQERTLYKNELSLVCDQRYSVSDMNRMVGIIKQFTE